MLVVLVASYGGVLQDLSQIVMKKMEVQNFRNGLVLVFQSGW